MAGASAQLKRAIFGYNRRSVLQTLIDRDVMFGRVQQGLQTTEAELSRTRAVVEALRGELGDRTRQAKQEADRLDEELAKTRARLEEAQSLAEERAEETRAATQRMVDLQADVERLREELRRLESAERPSDPGGEPAGTFTSEELAMVLENAEQAMVSVFERARQGNERHLREIEQAQRALRAERDELAQWRGEIAEVMRSVRDSATDARSQIEQTPGRLREALGPTTEAMTSVTDWLAELARITERLQGTKGPEAAPQAENVEQAEPDVAERDGSSEAPDDPVHEGLPPHYRWQ